MTTIAIVGAGCSGTLLAAQLLHRHAPPGARVLLYERTGSFGRGLAYGTRLREHLLNVPAGNMSAFPDRPDHFLEWAQQHDATAASDSFLPRRLYGAYLAGVLDDAAHVGEARGVTLVRRRADVAGVRPLAGGALQIELANGAHESADAAVLALGNLPRGPLPWDTCGHAIPDPWAEGALEIDADAPVLLLGSGLTMFDVAVSLDAAGHRAPIYAASRHGLLPQPHRAGLARAPRTTRPDGIDAWPRTARGLLRAVRGELARAATRGDDWRAVIASLRGDTPRLWSALPLREKRRFLEHLQPWWDTHRHRAAPATAAIVGSMRESGRLEVLAGRVRSVEREPDAGRARVRIALRGGGERALRVAKVVDCTGSGVLLRRTSDRLVGSLVASGVAQLDALGIGFATAANGALVGAGAAAPIFAMGPLRRGTLWESTAVPEIRVEAERLAASLADLVRNRRPRSHAVA